jgi:hypothetical protein
MVWTTVSRGKAKLTPRQLSIRLKKMALGEEEERESERE